MALPESLLGLLHERAYPHSCDRIELIETHISWVLLTGEFAYKLKKPVRFSFLDFSTAELRKHYCHEELRCNRMFAPQLYIDIVAIRRHADGSLIVGGEVEAADTVLEWAVQMREFDPSAQLDRLLEQHQVTPDMLATFGQKLATLHAALPRLEGDTSDIQRRVIAPVTDNFTEIETTGLLAAHAPLAAQTHELSDNLGDTLLPQLETRIRDGHTRECHGDLHLSNLALIDDRVTAFDCLEFNADLRWIDTISDVAFLFMDCHERGRADLAYAFLNGYLNASGDYRGAELLGYYAAYRSVVRAKVAALRWDQQPEPVIETRFVQHLEWARTWLGRPPGTLVLVCGLSGSGKSYVAQRLAPLLPAIHLRSDVARKTLAGLDTLAKTDSPVGGGLYKPSRSDAVYAFMADRARALLSGGEHVLVDATFISRARRSEFLALARQLGTRATVVYCMAPVTLLQERIEKRAAQNSDPSEATHDVLDAQCAQLEPPGPDEPVIKLATDSALEADELRALASRLKADPGAV